MKNVIIYLFSKLPLIKRLVNLRQHRNNLMIELELTKREMAEFKKNTVSSIKELLNRISLMPESVNSGKGLRIVHICAGDWGGGGNILALQLHEYLLKRGIDSKMLVGDKKTNLETVDVFKTSNELDRWYKQLSNEAKNEGLIDLLNLDAFQIINHTWIQSATVIHIHNIHGDFFSWFVLPFLCKNKKVVWTLHDMYPLAGHCGHAFDCMKWQADCDKCPDLKMYPDIKKDTAKDLLQIKKDVYSKINPVFISPSDWQLNNTSNSNLKDFVNKRIYNGIDISCFIKFPKKEMREELNLPADKNILIYIGNLGLGNPFKGTEYILNLIEWVNQKKDFIFLIIGGKEDKRECNVHFVSYKTDKKDLAKYLSAADIFIMPTLADNCPLVLIESMACGLPVVGFNIGGVPEIIDHKVNGYVSNYKDTEDLIRGIDYICNLSDVQYQMMSDKAVDTVRTKFSLDLMVDEYVGVYED